MSVAEPPALEAPEPRPSRWEIPAAAALCALLLVSFFSVPWVGAVAVPFAAVPLVRLAFRRGLLAAVAAGGLAAAAVAGLVFSQGGASGALAVGGSILAAVMLPALAAVLVRRGAAPSHAFLGLCAAGALLANGVLLFRSAGGPSVTTELQVVLDGSIPAALESYRRARMDPETLARVEGTLRTARDFTIRYWAGLTAACWVLAAAVGFFTGARLARPERAASLVRFERLRVHPAAAALFVAAGAGFALLRGAGRTVAGDLLLALAALYFVAGLSIICHFARRWFRIRILRYGLYVLVAYFPMNVGVALVGLFDWYLNFRRRGEGATET